MSRLRFVIALAVLALSSIALAACGDESDNSDASPEAVVKKATLSGIDSAEVDFSLQVDAAGKEGGDLSVSLAGPFQTAEEGGKPQFDLDAKVSGEMNGEEIDFEGGLVLLPNSAYVNHEGTEYEVDPTTFSFVESAINQAQQQEGAEGSSPGAAACQKVAEEIDLASFIDNLENEGSADVGGTSTTKLSGDLNVSGAIDSLTTITKDQACRSQLEAAGEVPSADDLSEAEKELSRSLKDAHVELYVGDDDIVRRIVADLSLQPKKQGDGPGKVEIDFELTLEGVNESQEIPVPENAKPLSDLFLKLGVNPLELAGALQGGEGLGSLLEELGGAAAGDGQGGPGGGSGGGDGGRQAYLDCISGASNAADLQKCNELLR